MYTHKHNAIKPVNGGYVIKRFLLELDDLHIICTLVFVYVCTFVYSLSANTTIPFNFASSLMQKRRRKKGGEIVDLQKTTAKKCIEHVVPHNYFTCVRSLANSR